MNRRVPPGWVWALAGLTGLGALFRFWSLTDLPPGYWYDEAHKSLVALEIVRGLRAPIYVTDGAGLESGYFWLLAAWFRLFGPGYYTSRALSALLGAATVPLTFWATVALYRPFDLARARRVGLISAAVLSYLLWHVHWSRLGLETILVPLASVALLGLMAWAWQRQGGWAFALAGAVLGLSQYTNPGARILPLQALATFALLAHGPRTQVVKYGLAFAAGALLAYAPLGWFFVRNPEWFFGRLSFVSTHARAGGLAFYLDSALKTVLSLNIRGDILVRHNLAGRPALDPIASVWMVAGLAAMLRRRGAARAHLACLAALVVNLLPMVFSDGAPGFGRTLGATPMLVMLPALGVVWAWEQNTRRRWIAALVTVSLLASGAWNAYDYFVRYPRQPGLFDAFEVGLWRLSRAASEAGRSGVGYLVLDEASLQHPTIRLTRELERGDVRFVNGQTCFAYPEVTSVEATFATLPAWAPALAEQFPQATTETILHEPEVYEYGALMKVPAGQHSREPWRPALAFFGGKFELLEASGPPEGASPGATIPIHLAWRSAAPDGLRYTVFVHLATADVPYRAGTDAEPCAAWYPTSAWHTGEIVEYDLALSLPADLLPGAYDLAVGMYAAETYQRLPVAQVDAREPDRAFVGVLDVR